MFCFAFSLFFNFFKYLIVIVWFYFFFFFYFEIVIILIFGLILIIRFALNLITSSVYRKTKRSWLNYIFINCYFNIKKNIISMSVYIRWVHVLVCVTLLVLSIFLSFWVKSMRYMIDKYVGFKFHPFFLFCFVLNFNFNNNHLFMCCLCSIICFN